MGKSPHHLLRRTGPPKLGEYLLLHFDGGFNLSQRTATYGWHLDTSPSSIRIGSGHGAVCGCHLLTVNVAEWVALVEALRWVAGHGVEGMHLAIRGDSMLVCKQLSGKWRCKRTHLQRYRDESLWLLKQIGASWDVGWVPREENRQADALARC